MWNVESGMWNCGSFQLKLKWNISLRRRAAGIYSQRGKCAAVNVEYGVRSVEVVEVYIKSSIEYFVKFAYSDFIYRVSRLSQLHTPDS